MPKRIYTTQERSGGYKNRTRTHYEYDLSDDGSEITRTRVSRQKFFDGHENNWDTDRTVTDTWGTDDASKPDWLDQYL